MMRFLANSGLINLIWLFTFANMQSIFAMSKLYVHNTFRLSSQSLQYSFSIWPKDIKNISYKVSIDIWLFTSILQCKNYTPDPHLPFLYPFFVQTLWALSNKKIVLRSLTNQSKKEYQVFNHPFIWLIF